MADVTGRVYEAFVEFILRRLGYRDEWTDGSGRQYLYEKHPPAPCHRAADICPYSRECHDFSVQHNIPYGPWYDPDFFILNESEPVACVHVTHWSSPANSPFKFWRTIEDHLEYKTLFGRKFMSVNLIFEALSEGEDPRLVQDMDTKISIKGWKPAIGSMLVTSFDASILFPEKYNFLERFGSQIPLTAPRNAHARRDLYNQTWTILYDEDRQQRARVDKVVQLLRRALESPPHPRYTAAAIAHLQRVCYNGRLQAVDLRPTVTRYRKGIQQAFILREMTARHWGAVVNPDDCLWSVLQSSPRFLRDKSREVFGLSETAPEADMDEFRSVLASIPVRIDKGHPHNLLINDAGLGHATWDEDFTYFILGLRNLKPGELMSFRQTMLELFAEYRTAYGMNDTLADLYDPNRIQAKVDYIAARYLPISDEREFVRAVVADAVTPGKTAPHSTVARDKHNWPLDVLLTFYDLGSMQHITACLPAKFEQKYRHSLRPYAFLNNLGQLISHLLQGVAVGSYFSRGVQMTEAEFYSAIWPLFAECLWDAIQVQRHRPLTPETVITLYRYKKAMRIMASPDLEPIAFLFRRMLPTLTAGPTLRGAFNQLSTQRGWSREALTTDSAGLDPRSGAIIQTQAVVGAKNIDHKVKELAARLRSVHLKCSPDGTFAPEPNPGKHYLVVDGDWPITSKINLYEAGFQGIYEIGELDRLMKDLEGKEADS